jgi:hypothetical protein
VAEEMYTQRAYDSSFMDLKDDKEFQVDLVRFFSGGRYNLSREEMEEVGMDGLTEKFVEHMRVQAWNEVTQAKDLNYLLNKDLHRKGKESFARLQHAWDVSQEAGDDFGDAALDYAEGIFTAPSTYLGLGSFGLGKLASKAAGKAAQVAIRNYTKRLLSKNVVGRSAALGAASGAVTEGAVGAGQSYQLGEQRELASEFTEDVPEFEYTGQDLAKDTAISAAFGGILGSAGGFLSGKTAKSKDAMTAVQEAKRASANVEAKKAANARFKSSNPARQQDAAQRVSDVESVLAAKLGDKTAKVRDPLDPEKVLAGNEILNKLSNPDFDGVFKSGLSMDTMRSLTAATIDIVEELQINEGERITSAIANKIRSGDVAIVDKVNEIRQKYNLSQEQFSLLYLAEVSNAGKILAEQSIISKAARAAGRLTGSDLGRTEFDGLSVDLTTLAQSGISTFNDQVVTELTAEVVKNSAQRSKTFKYIVDPMREIDAARIAFMTSQPATTIRNAASTVLLAGVDVSDEFFRGLVRYGKAAKEGDLIPEPGKTVKRMTATLRGMTWNNAQASLLKDMFAEEMPQTYAAVFNDAMRLELGTASNSMLAKTGRAVNVFNTALDTTFKQAAFFASLDRQLTDQGITVGQFIASGKKLEDLGQDTIRKAYDDANRFTMQRTYVGDESAFGKTARFAVNVNRKVPFLVSGALGIPFPRYVANHLEMLSDYTPVWGHYLAKTPAASDPIKTAEDRVVRQMTGASLLMLGYAAAAEKEGDVDYKSIETAIKGQADVSSSLGFIIGHMYAGDLAYRWKNGLPMPSAGELETVLGGVGDFSADFTFIQELINSSKEGQVTEGFQKAIGNLAATLTYPATISRDFVGQYDYDAAGNPYIRDVMGQNPFDNPGDVSLTGEVTNFHTGVAQATRMLPDIKSIQYTQSFNGETDIPMYSILNPMKVGAMNPLLKQITGVSSEPPMTDIEREFNRMGLKEYQVYKPYAVRNPSVHYLMTYNLSQTLHETFDNWRKDTRLGGLANGKTYDQIEDNDLKKEALLKFVEESVSLARTDATKKLEDGLANNKKSVKGYIRLNYEIKRQELGVEYFDRAAEQISRGEFKTAKDYLMNSDSPKQELERRLGIVEIAGDISSTR